MDKFDEAIIEFNKYAKQFDFNNENIKRKYKHTFRVVEYAINIAKSENLNEHDVYLASVCALLHDIARFKQETEFGTYIDKLSFDHGDIGFEILLENNYIEKYVYKDIDKKIVLKAVKNHNKFEVESGLTKKEMFFAKLVRDADKLDIMDLQGNEILDNDYNIPYEVFNAIVEQRLVVRDGKKESDIKRVFITLNFIFDINFKKSMEIINEKNLINKKIQCLEGKIDNNKIEVIKNKILTFHKNWY